MVAALTRRFGDLDIAEEAAAEAFATAVERWPADGVPPNPGALAHHHRHPQGHRPDPRESQPRRQAAGGSDAGRRRPAPSRSGAVDDDRLRLHLHLLSPGAARRDPGRADAAHGRRSDRARDRPRLPGARRPPWAQRITRAKAKIKAARIPYRVPSAEDLPARLAGVLAVLFLVFNEGYLATGADTDPVRQRPDRRGDPADAPGPRAAAGRTARWPVCWR